MTRPSILFVDDDQQVLDGLSSSLWKQRRAWDMTFACGGGAALALLDTRRFDAIVTDMRMPLIDGEAVLTSFAARSPGTVRVILSGQTDRAVVHRTTGMAHQFLSKPCPVDELRDCLQDMLVVATSMESRARDLVVAIGSLPISSRSVARLDALAGGADRTELVRCIEADVGLTAKLLHIASAGFVSRRRQAKTVDDALAAVGTQDLRACLAAVEIHEPTPEVEWLLEHALATGKLLERHAANDSRAFLCGVLHGLGKLALFRAFGPRYRAMIADAEHDPLTRLSDFEVAEFGISHDAIAAHLVKLWNLSPSIASVLYHHCQPTAADEDLTIALHVACVRANGRTCLDRELVSRDPRVAFWDDQLQLNVPAE